MNGDNTMDQNQNSSGSLVGSIIVVIILIIGAIYLFSSKTNAPVMPAGETGVSGEQVVTETAGTVTTEVITEETISTQAEMSAQESANLESSINSLNQEAGL